MAEGETMAGGESSEAAASSLVATMAADDSARPRRRSRRQNTMPEKGSTVGRYVVVSRLGAGAMGVVVAAYDPQLDRKVAIKLLRSRYRNSAIDRTRLQREAQALARLNHPNVVSVHDVGVHEERVFVAMEFVAGRNLRQWLDQAGGRRPWPEVVEVFEAAGRGLAAAHAEALVHRDFKPENVMIGDDGRVRVMDFGLVRATTTPSSEGAESRERRPPRVDGGAIEDSAGDSLEISLTQVGALMGTPAYMAPEQFMGAEVDERCDQFAFCVSLYEALYGERPFEGDSVPALAEATMTGGRKAVPRGVEVPGWLRRIVHRGLIPEPDGRYASMAELLVELGALEAKRRRRRWSVGIAAVGVAALSLWGVYRYDLARAVAACEQQGRSIDEVWNDTAREAVRAGLVATELDYAPAVAERVMPWLDGYAQQWREHATEACMQGRVREAWSPQTLDKAQWCLDEERQHFIEYIEQLQEATPMDVRKAVVIAANLSSSVSCVDQRSLFARAELPEPDDRDRVRAVQGRLREVLQLKDTGEYDRAQARAEEVRAQADALGWAPLRVEVVLEQARILGAQARYEEAEALAIEAYLEAVRADLWQLAANTAITLMDLVGVRQARLNESKLWAEHAAVAIDKSGNSMAVGRVNLAKQTGDVYLTSGEYEQARAYYERALSVWRENYSGDHPELASVLSGLGNVHQRLGHDQEARQLHEQALDMRIRVLGSQHPALAISLVNLGVVLSESGEYERGKQLYRQALTIIEKTVGPNHPNVAAVVNNLAFIHLMLREYAQARPLYERAVSIKEKALGPEHPNLLLSIKGLGLSLAGLGEYTAAIPVLERTLALPAPQRSASDEASVRLALARSLWEAPEAGGRDRERARALATKVAVQEGDDVSDERAQAEAWLDEHPTAMPTVGEPAGDRAQ